MNQLQEIINELQTTFKSQKTIAKEFGISKYAVSRIVSDHNVERPDGYEEYLQKINGGKVGYAQSRKINLINDGIDEELPRVEPKERRLVTAKLTQIGGAGFRTNVELFKEFISEQDLVYKSKPMPQSSRAKSAAWLVAGDWHIPYVDKTKMHKMVNDFIMENQHIGLHGLVINGDFLDGYALNSFGKDDRAERFQDEVSEGRIILNWLSSVFDEIIVVDDNHVTSRFKKLLEGKIDPQLHFLIQDPYDMLTHGFGNVRRSNKTYLNGEEIGWFTQVGDAILCHAEVHSSAPLKAVHYMAEWFTTWQKELGLSDFKCVVQSHVHKGGEYWIPGKDIKVLEAGCLVTARGVKYSMKADAKYKPPVNGAVHLIQHNGVTDLNKTKFVKL